MTLKEACELKRLGKDKRTWREINEAYGKHYVDGNSLRMNWHTYTGDPKPPPDLLDNRERLEAEIHKGGVNKVDFALKYNCNSKVLDQIIADISNHGLNIVEKNGILSLSKSAEIKAEVKHYAWGGQRQITFGIVSDTHLCSMWQQLTHLRTAYATFKERGITKVFHVGDLCEGDKMRPGHEYELFIHGADDQCDYIVDKYPKIDGTTEFIVGSHDLSHMKRAGTNIGKRIAEKRADMNFLGGEEAKVFLTPNCSIGMLHPGGGSAYSISYKPQKIVEAMQGGTKPTIALFGHYHKTMYFEYRNVHIFQSGCLQAQTAFLTRMGISVQVGFWIITVNLLEDGTLTRIVPEWYPFYLMNEKDYE